MRLRPFPLEVIALIFAQIHTETEWKASSNQPLEICDARELHSSAEHLHRILLLQPVVSEAGNSQVGKLTSIERIDFTAASSAP